MDYIWIISGGYMRKERVTKTLSMEKSLIQIIENIAKEERRSFTQQAELLLERALRNQYGFIPDDGSAETKRAV
jgi:hypothetical protein